MNKTIKEKLPAHFFKIPYNSNAYPGNAIGLGDGANCQQFVYEILHYFNYEISDLRSDELMSDTQYTILVNGEVEPFDLLLFHHKPEAFGAHVGLSLGNNEIIHLSKNVGLPRIQTIYELQNDSRYPYLIGIKRPIKKTKRNI